MGPATILGDHDLEGQAAPFLREQARKLWHEIDSEKAGKDHRNKSYPISAIIKEAQDRLITIELNDLDEIFRFRLSGRERLYGFIVQHIFYVVWWDPRHRICESDIQERGKQRRK